LDFFTLEKKPGVGVAIGVRNSGFGGNRDLYWCVWLFCGNEPARMQVKVRVHK
jgi:hypothetical protein